MRITRIDEIAANLDDIATMLDEMKEDSQVPTKTFAKLRQSIEKAIDAIDRLENQQIEPKEG